MVIYTSAFVRPNRGYLSLQTLGGSVCLQEKRKKLRVLFTAGLMSTFHKELDFRVINQTRLVKKVEVRPLRPSFLSSNEIKGNWRGSHKSEVVVNVLKMFTWGRVAFSSPSKMFQVSSELML